jgi:hypothetical protein
MEQISNAVALKQLGHGDVIHYHDTAMFMRWLDKPNPVPRPYPNVARAIVDWIRSGMVQDTKGLAQEVWEQYQYI